MTTILDTPRLNGHSFERPVAKKKPSRARKALKISTTQVSNLKTYITVAMGIGIPLLSLSLSSLGGSLLAAGAYGLGVVALGLCGVCLAVSLSHLAWAVRDVTKSPTWASVALALAVDATLVLSELTGVLANEADVRCLRLVLMVAVTVASMALNCWAFLKHSAAK